MDDFILRTTLGDSRTIYISPIDRDTYDEHIGADNLGGEDGYFLMVAREAGYPRVEVLAKVPTLDAARALFDLISCSQADSDNARRMNYGLAPAFR
jgi:hypothetical protein